MHQLGVLKTHLTAHRGTYEARETAVLVELSTRHIRLCCAHFCLDTSIYLKNQHVIKYDTAISTTPMDASQREPSVHGLGHVVAVSWSMGNLVLYMSALGVHNPALFDDR